MTRVFRWGALTLCFLHAAVVGREGFADDRETTKILLIGKQPDHSFGTHMYLHTQAMLAECLERTKEIETEVSDDWPEYDLHDEFYLNPVIRDASPLLQVTAAGQDVVVGWVHERDSGGCACATTLGHFDRNFQIESFRRMVVNSILWTAHVDIPPDGAPVNLSEAELDLPPRPEE